MSRSLEIGPTPVHPSADELAAGLADVQASPADRGVLELIVRRPAVDQREVLAEAFLDPTEGRLPRPRPKA